MSGDEWETTDTFEAELLVRILFLISVSKSLILFTAVTSFNCESGLQYWLEKSSELSLSLEVVVWVVFSLNLSLLNLLGFGIVL